MCYIVAARLAEPHLTDYTRAKPIEVRDYGDIHNPANDPIQVAMGICGETEKRAWGHWVRNLNAARKKFGTKADREFREMLALVWSEDRAGEVKSCGAVLNFKLARKWKIPRMRG